MAIDIAYEAAWLHANPHFRERPATIAEFLGVGYLDIESEVRPAIRDALIDMFGEEVSGDRIAILPLAIITGAIGIGKTTCASIILTYMVHWVSCLWNPQKYFNLLPGSRIAFMQMSTSRAQAQAVVFGDIKARILNSDWFKRHCPFDPSFKNQLHFPKDIWIVPGDSGETTFEGFNILGGIIDEADSHQVTQHKDYAEEGYDCADDETQILTTEGWKHHWELSNGDTVLTLRHEEGVAEWEPVLEVRRFEVADEKLIRMEGKEFSSLTTPNHRWPVVGSRGVRGWTTTEGMNTGDSVPVCAPVDSVPIVPIFSDAFVESVAWFWTEGHIRRASRNVDIYQSIASKHLERMRSAFAGAFGAPVPSFPRRGSTTDGIPRWRESTNRALAEFHFSADAGDTLVEFAPDRVPTFAFLSQLTQSQLDLFIEVSLLADNCGVNKLAQKSEAAADAFALACILSGRGVSIRKHHDKAAPYDMNLVRILTKRFASPVKASREPQGCMTISPEIYSGTVWCPRTGNRSWLARRNGSVYFTGNTIRNRIDSRFGDRGFLIVIGQMKRSDGFAKRTYDSFVKRDDAYALHLTIWESFGLDHSQYQCTEVGPHKLAPELDAGQTCGAFHTFPFDMRRKEVITDELAAVLGTEATDVIRIPMLYFREFETNPEKSLRDLAGVPPLVGDPFIGRPYKIEEARDRWIANLQTGPESPIGVDGVLADWFKVDDSIPRVGHIDVAYAADGDAYGFGMGHIEGVVDIDGELKPYIVIDLLYRKKAASGGGEVDLSEARHFIYDLRDGRSHVKLKKITMDGFQSTDSMQQLRKRRFEVEYLSVDKTLLPYYDLRDALYEDRIEIPPYYVHIAPGATEVVEIAVKELSELIDNGKKVDHPMKGGSKDIADCIAGVVSTLMANRAYRRNTVSLADHRDRKLQATGTDSYVRHPAYRGDLQGVRAPLPPRDWRSR